MSKYQVMTIRWPENWKPECADDVPLELNGPVEVLVESDDLFAALDRAIEHNNSPEAQRRGRWAVVIEPGSVGRVWPAARLCTPVVYKVTAIWWPDGWEPASPLDVPNCVWQIAEKVGGQWLAYPAGRNRHVALNRQCMDHPGAAWHVVVAIENEADLADRLPRSVRHGNHRRDAPHPRDSARERAATASVRIVPPTHFECAKSDWSSQMQRCRPASPSIRPTAIRSPREMEC